VRQLLTLLAAACLLAACGEPAPWRQESYVFGTRVEVLIAGVPEARARAAGNRVLQEFDRLHRTYHAWQPSELSALNEAIAAGRVQQVTPEFAGYLREAQEVAAAGDHLFDPGIGRLIALWGFHTDDIQARLPDAGAVQALLAQHPSIADLRIEGTRVGSANRSVAIDFGGYLKGVALDRAAASLKQDGITDALINIGGNVMALGSKGGQPWRVGIQHPRSPGTLASMPLHDGEAVGTSGDYQRYFEIDGKRYCHLLDPRTGRPAEAVQAVTVLIPPRDHAGALSDAASKPLFLAADGEWQRLATRIGIQHVLRVDGEGRITATRGLVERLELAPGVRIDHLLE